MASLETYEFLFVKPGDHVVIKNEKPPGNIQNGRPEYWIGQVINCIGCLLYTSPSPRDRG